MKRFSWLRRIVPLAMMLVAVSGCFDSGEEKTANEEQAAGMDGDIAACDFPVLTFKLQDGSLKEVDINGLAVHPLNGASKSGADQVELVERRGVLFADIFDKGGITVPDETPVNCIARDGYDPLRTKMEGDTGKLPDCAFFKAHAYVYLSNPGDKDPLYPEMEGLSLAVDYDLAGDDEVPPELGGTLVTLNMLRFKMVEKVDEETRGIFELGPVL